MKINFMLGDNRLAADVPTAEVLNAIMEDVNVSFEVFNALLQRKLRENVHTVLASEGSDAADDEAYVAKIADLLEDELTHEEGTDGKTHYRNLIDKLIDDNPFRVKHEYIVRLKKVMVKEVKIECYEDEVDDNIEDLTFEKLDEYDAPEEWEDDDPYGEHGGIEIDDYDDNGEVDK